MNVVTGGYSAVGVTSVVSKARTTDDNVYLCLPVQNGCHRFFQFAPALSLPF